MFRGSIWYRVEIIYISGSDAYVHFIDVGCKRKAKVDDFFYLTEKFAAPTRKACKGTLFGVKPFGKNCLWSTTATEAFKAKVNGQRVLATVKAVTDGTYELSLIHDRLKNQTLEDYLLDKKFAEPSREVKPTMEAILVRKHLKLFAFCFIILFTSFRPISSRKARPASKILTCIFPLT